ncbi:glyoxylase-like metal-dependent hydrolase (beta-lactamase superfamily II) [Mycolicibacterium sp. BK556]|uniref:MBL fold metallo-hydrolase n=1 Tax=unclassified Mycolicibacterium TaxID=2636767 RepID=UPI001613BF8E|nr:MULTISPECIES: MBL fold metallo-hydrolase [unclassified Mycolicibacterium]MBB3603662.1 glyoxylase-like metal-dependent hydrolase (beta-lactamase superfamily II) [Mycolicibacterium sp. BK556]MBB3633857.1 glyoxylase-like metal-dependent hydrolase (beta-lactamase superfamily II) [Mycolicibacterium sp. BK607]MBB3751439.1 glyoxylase-like metal-dependent hydrolase (beta-lactamase superfamily II) [Mycolicibacterium sp. BK634]
MHYSWETLSDRVYRCRLPFLDVTVGLVSGTNRTLLIDCGTTLSEAARITDDVGELTGGAVTDVVMTHHHFDHILGSAGFGTAVLYAPAAVAEALTTGIGEVRAHALQYGADPERLDRAIAGVRAPDHIVTRTDLDLGGRSVHLELAGPGHTDHDLVVVVPGQPAVVFCGDLIEESGDPVIDAGSDLPAWPHAVDRVLAWGGPYAIYVPGHGAVVDARFVSTQRDWLSDRDG